MDSAAGGHATFENGADLAGHLADGFMNPGGGCGSATFHGKIGLGDGNYDLGFVVGDDSAIALDNAKLTRRGSG